MNFVELFNSQKKDELYSDHKDRIISNFQSAVLQLQAIQNDKYEICQNQLRGWLRLTMGYRGIGFNNGVYSKIKTKQTISKKSSEITFDHVVGTTLCGETVKKVIEEQNFNITYLIDEWLFDNMYLWGTIKVTKEQHKKENILRNKHLLSEKLNLDHYKNISLDDLVREQENVS